MQELVGEWVHDRAQRQVLGLDGQVRAARPVSPLPAESRGVAVSCTVPATTTLAAAGVTLTAATGTGSTVTVAVSDRPVAVAIATTLYWPGGWGAHGQLEEPCVPELSAAPVENDAPERQRR